MRNYSETCKGIYGYNLAYNFFAYLLPLKTSVFAVDHLNAFWHGNDALAKHGSYTKVAPLFVIFDLTVIWMFRFYKTVLNLKTRLQEQNLKKILIFFHYCLNLFICCKTKWKIKFIFYRMSLFYRFFFSRVKFI